MVGLDRSIRYRVFRETDIAGLNSPEFGLEPVTSSAHNVRQEPSEMDTGFVADVVTGTSEDGVHIVGLADHDPPSSNQQIDLLRQLANHAGVELA